MRIVNVIGIGAMIYVGFFFYNRMQELDPHLEVVEVQLAEKAIEAICDETISPESPELIAAKQAIGESGYRRLVQEALNDALAEEEALGHERYCREARRQ